MSSGKLKKQKKILLVSRDPGATNQLVALHKLILAGDAAVYGFSNTDGKPEILVLAKEFARESWSRADIPATDWDKEMRGRSIRDFLLIHKPDQIFTGTSHLDDFTEQSVWRVAHDLNISVSVLLDCDENIVRRFLDVEGNLVKPDKIFVFDQKSKNELLQQGMTDAEVIVGRDLYVDYLESKQQKSARYELRKEWNRRQGETVILFASDYISEIGLDALEIKVTEFECLEHLIKMLKTGKNIKGLRAPFRLVIRPHPKDTPGKYDSYSSIVTPGLTVVVSNAGWSADAVRAADMVAGMNSSLLKEAAVFNIPVLRLIPLVLNIDPQRNA